MLQAIIGALCGVGLFFVLADVYRIPYLKTSKAVESLSKQQKEKTSALNIWLGNLAEFLARHMHLIGTAHRLAAEVLELRQDRTATQL